MGKLLLIPAAALLGLSVLTACETTSQGVAEDAAVPADAPPEVRGKAIYERSCNRCHALFMPQTFGPDEWPYYVRKYGRKARLDPEQRALVLSYLRRESA